jgi:hypothetical protein
VNKITCEEIDFLVKFSFIFNVDSVKLCARYNIPLRNFNSWKSKSNLAFDAFELLDNVSSPVSTAEAATVCADPTEPPLRQQWKQETGVGTEVVLHTDNFTQMEKNIWNSPKPRKPFQELGERSRRNLLVAATNHLKNFFNNDLILLSNYPPEEKEIIFYEIIQSLYQPPEEKNLLKEFLETFSLTLKTLLQ